MKIAFYSTYILEYGGGLEKYLIETASHLASLPGTTADVITMDDAFMTKMNDRQSRLMGQKIDHNINYRESLEDIKKRLGKANYYKVPDFKTLRKKLREYDVVYSKNELRETFILRFCVGYKNIPPVVFGGHTPLAYPNPTALSAKVRNFLYNGPAYKLLAGGGHTFHAINTHEAGRYAELFPNKKVVKIYNPFDLERFRARAKQHPYNPDPSADAINILWAGRLTEQKGVRDLAEIIAQVNKNLPSNVQVIWNIFGDGDQKNIVTDLAKQQPNVRYHGHTDQKTMPGIYSQNHVFLSTSKWEGYPYTLIELQAFGLQGFAYDIPGPTDIFAEYEGGHIAQDKHEMSTLLTAMLKRYKIAKNVPRSKPSRQFEPEPIYKQLHHMLQLKD